MVDVFDRYYDTAGNYHYSDTETGHHVIKMNSNQEIKKEEPVMINAPQTGGLMGWICPVCGRGLSPFTSVCPCKNGNGWEVTC